MVVIVACKCRDGQTIYMGGGIAEAVYDTVQRVNASAPNPAVEIWLYASHLNRVLGHRQFTEVKA